MPHEQVRLHTNITEAVTAGEGRPEALRGLAGVDRCGEKNVSSKQKRQPSTGSAVDGWVSLETVDRTTQKRVPTRSECR